MEIKREKEMMDLAGGEGQTAAVARMEKESTEVQSETRAMDSSIAHVRAAAPLAMAQPNTAIKKETADDEISVISSRAISRPSVRHRSRDVDVYKKKAEDDVYVSQEHEIVRRAREYGVEMRTLNKYFDDKIEEVAREFPGSGAGWRLGRTEYLLWEHFCESLS